MTRVPHSDILTRPVCLQLDGMDVVTVRRNVAYGPPDGRLRMDLYYPSHQTDEGRWPAVIIVAGYPGTGEPRPTSLTFKEMGWTVSMSRLIAVSGMVAIAYTNQDPVADLRALFEHIHEHARSLRIDAARVGVIAASGSVPTALSTIMQDAGRTPACAVFSYGCLLDLDDATHVADAARQFGFVNPGVGRTLTDLRRDVPLLITRAGRDQFPGMNASIDSFIRQGLVENLPITFVNHVEGPHAFDLVDASRASRDILRQTLRFLQQHLTAEGSDGSVTQV
jgi:hypothetical protein